MEQICFTRVLEDTNLEDEFGVSVSDDVFGHPKKISPR